MEVSILTIEAQEWLRFGEDKAALCKVYPEEVSILSLMGHTLPLRNKRDVRGQGFLEISLLF